MYKDEAEKMLCNYSAVPDTPEMERIKSTQKNISAVSNSDFLFTCNFSDIFSLNRLSSASAWSRERMSKCSLIHLHNFPGKDCITHFFQ